MAALLLGACETQPTHEVLGLTDLSPRVMEPGERVVLHAAGLPSPQDIRRVTVRVTGRLSRPGLGPCARPVSLELRDPPEDAVWDPTTGESRPASYATDRSHSVVISGGDHLEFVLTPAMLRALTQCPGERATASPRHATVSLLGPGAGVSLQVDTAEGASLSTARPLRGVVIDLHSGPRDLPGEMAARREADRALSALGLTLAETEVPEGGLAVASVASGSIAESVGVASGDVLVSLDGLRLESPSDFRPGRDRATATLALRRGEVLEERRVPLAVTRGGLSSDGFFTLVLAALLLAVALGAHAGAPASLRWLAMGLRRDDDARDARSTWARLVDAARSASRGWVAPTAVTVTALALPAGPTLVALDPDLVASQAVVSLAAVALAMIAAKGEGWRASVTSAGRRLLLEVPGALALAAAAMHGAGTRTHAVVSAQGATPWRWNLLRDPALLALGAAALLAPLARDGDDDATPALTASRRALAVARGALLAAVLMGGWCVPGARAERVEASVTLQMLGVALLVAKGCAWAAAAEVGRRRLSRVHPSAWVRLALSRAVPAGAAALGLAALAAWASTRVSPEALASASRGAAWATVGLAVFALLAARGPRSVEG
ncbi:MAG: hypothetical protein R3A52_25495 [Polyangiales bacterium]